MDLSKVQETMIPAVHEILRSGIGLPAGADALMLVAIDIALKESGGEQSLAARKLGVTQSFISKAINGKSLTRFRKRGPYKKKDQEQE